MRTLPVLLYAILFSPITYCQITDPSVLASAGGINSNSRMTLEWTLGEASVSTISYSDKILTEGFHQPLIIIVNKRNAERVNHPLIDLSVTIAPNPVFSILNVKFSGRIDSRLTLSLINSSGKLLSTTEASVKSLSTRIAMDQLPGGIYFLRITDNKGLLKTFKIIKL